MISTHQALLFKMISHTILMVHNKKSYSISRQLYYFLLIKILVLGEITPSKHDSVEHRHVKIHDQEQS